MRNEVLLAALAKYGITPCGDNSCMFGPPGGMATNGGCCCIERMESERTPRRARVYIQKLAAALRDLSQPQQRDPGGDQ